MVYLATYSAESQSLRPVRRITIPSQVNTPQVFLARRRTGHFGQGIKKMNGVSPGSVLAVRRCVGRVVVWEMSQCSEELAGSSPAAGNPSRFVKTVCTGDAVDAVVRSQDARSHPREAIRAPSPMLSAERFGEYINVLVVARARYKRDGVVLMDALSEIVVALSHMPSQWCRCLVVGQRLGRLAVDA